MRAAVMGSELLERLYNDEKDGKLVSSAFRRDTLLTGTINV